MKTVLSVEESTRLIELGVDKNLADIVSANEPYYPDDVEFSLGALFSILPKKVTDRRKVYNLTMGVNSEDLYYAKYMNIHNCCDELDSYQDAHELCDCIYDMIVWLKENPELVWL